jgi:hypothetical protein
LTAFKYAIWIGFAILAFGTAPAPALAESTFRYPVDGAWTVTNDFWSCSYQCWHLAEDAVSGAGTPVYAPSDGVVKHTAVAHRYGNVIIIEHVLGGETVASVMGHLRSSGLNVSVGQSVTKGYLLGYLGTSSQNGGWAPHSHFGVNKGAYTGQSTGCDGKWVYAGYAVDACVQSDWYDPSNFYSDHATYFEPFAGRIDSNNPGDIGLRNFTNGVISIRYGNGGGSFCCETQYGWAAGSHYEPFTADFNANNCGDIGLRDPTNGVFYIRYGNCAGGFGSETQFPWAAGYHYQPFVCDVNGNGYADIGLRDPTNGFFYVLYGNGSGSFGNQTIYPWALGGHYKAFAQDFDGNGRCDIGLRDPNDGVFYIQYGNGAGSFGSQTTHGWAAGYHYAPFAVRVDSGTWADIGLKDPSNGVWYIRYHIGGGSFCCETQYAWAPG